MTTNEYYCPKCQMYADEGKVCKKCMTPLIVSEKKVSVDDNKPGTTDFVKPKKSGHKAIIAALLVLIIGAAISIGYYYSNSVKCEWCGNRYMTESDKRSINMYGMCEKCWDEYVQTALETQRKIDELDSSMNYYYEHWLLEGDTSTK